MLSLLSDSLYSVLVRPDIPAAFHTRHAIRMEFAPSFWPSVQSSWIGPQIGEYTDISVEVSTEYWKWFQVIFDTMFNFFKQSTILTIHSNVKKGCLWKRRKQMPVHFLALTLSQKVKPQQAKQ